MPRKVRLGTFSPSVLVEVAEVTGALRDAELEVEEVPATSSPAQFTDLLDGELDAALTNPDNVLAYRCIPDNPLGRLADVRILAAVDRGLGLSLFASSGYTDPDDLRGGVLGVDVPGSGFAYVAYALLDDLGIDAGNDCTVEALGSTPRRARALLAGDCACTVLNAGNDLLAEAQGARRLGSVTSLGPYTGTVLAATGAAIERDRDMLLRLTRVLLETSTALIKGDHADLARAAASRRLDLDGTAADRYVTTLADHSEGLVGEGRLSPEDLETVIALRRRRSTDGPPLSLTTVLRSGLVDDSLLPLPGML